MSVPAPKKKSRKGLFALIIIIVAAVILAVPPVLAGGFTVPVSKVVFGERSGSLAASGTASANVSFVTAYEYYFLIRSRGTVQTTDSSDVSSSSGTVVLSMDLKLTNPSNLTTDLGNTTISGGIGTRTHTVYLSIDSGVRVSGTYTLNAYISAKVTVGGILEIGVSPIVVTMSFTVS